MGNQCCGEMRNADKQNGNAYTTVKPGDMPMDPQHTQGWGGEGEGQTGVVPQAPGFPGRGPPPPSGRMPPGPMNMMRGGPPPPGPTQPTYDEYGNEIYPPQQNMAPRPSAAPFPGRGPRPPIQQAPQAPPPAAAEPYWDDQQQQWIHPQPQASGYEGQQNVDEWGNPVQSTQGHEQQQNTSHDPYAQQNDQSQQHSESTGYDASQNSYSDPSSHSQSEPSYGEGELSVSQDSNIPSRPPSQSIAGRPPSASFSGGRPPSGSVGRRPPPNPPVLAGQGSAPGDEGSLMGRPPSASMSARPAPRQGPPGPGPGPAPAPGRAPMGRPSVGRRGPPAPHRGPPMPQQQQQNVDNYGNPIEEPLDGYSAPSPGQRPNPIQIPTAPTRTGGPNNMTPLALNERSSRSGPPTPGRGPTPGRLMTQASSGRIVNLDAPPAPELNPPLLSQSSHESSSSAAPGAHGVSADELSHARLTPQGERRRTMSSGGHQPQKSEDLGDFLTQALMEKRNQLTGNYSTLSIPGSGTTSPTPPPTGGAGGPKKFKPPASPRLGGRQMGPPSPSPPPAEQENYGYDQQQVDPSQQPWDETQNQQQYDDGTYQQYDQNGQQQYDQNGQQQYQEWQ